MVEVILAVIFVGFLTGFIAVLCIGNYYRAKRAMERQKQRRLARLSSGGGNGVVDSPRSHSSSGGGSQGASSITDHEGQHLLSTYAEQLQRHPTRRRNMEQDNYHDLLLLQENTKDAIDIMSV